MKQIYPNFWQRFIKKDKNILQCSICKNYFNAENNDSFNSYEYCLNRLNKIYIYIDYMYYCPICNHSDSSVKSIVKSPKISLKKHLKNTQRTFYII